MGEGGRQRRAVKFGRPRARGAGHRLQMLAQRGAVLLADVEFDFVRREGDQLFAGLAKKSSDFPPNSMSCAPTKLYLGSVSNFSTLARL